MKITVRMFGLSPCVYYLLHTCIILRIPLHAHTAAGRYMYSLQMCGKSTIIWILLNQYTYSNVIVYIITNTFIPTRWTFELGVDTSKCLSIFH